MVLRNRTRTVLEEWEADAEALASGPVRVPKGLTFEEVTRRRRSDAAPRLSSVVLEGYALAWAEFTDWLQEREIVLEEVEEVTVRVFLEDQGRVKPGQRPSKQAVRCRVRFWAQGFLCLGTIRGLAMIRPFSSRT